MKTSYIVALAVVVVVIIVGVAIWMNMGASGPTSNPASIPSANPTSAPMIPANPPAATSGATATSTPAISIMTSATLGNYLVASNGMTLYTSAADTPGVSNCTGACATAWPPYTISASQGLDAGANITGSLATIPNAGGALQVTYNGMPLYFWSKDVAPGDTTGENVGGFVVAKP